VARELASHEWTDSSWPWIDGTVLEDYVEPDESGLYHATTSFRAVMKEGLRSRRQLGGIVGLGGGWHQYAPDLVSFVPTYGGAVVIADAMIVMARVLREEIGAGTAARLALGWMDFPEHSVYQDSFELMDYEEGGRDELRGLLREVADALSLDTQLIDPLDLADRRAWLDLLDERAPVLDAEAARGRWVYEGIQTAEDLVSKHFWPKDSEVFQCAPFVGFTATAEQFARVDPRDVGIVWAEARVGADVDLFPIECELRFRPEDVRVVGGERILHNGDR
jgi:hypothetical protein